MSRRVSKPLNAILPRAGISSEPVDLQIWKVSGLADVYARIKDEASGVAVESPIRRSELKEGRGPSPGHARGATQSGNPSR